MTRQPGSGLRSGGSSTASHPGPEKVWETVTCDEDRALALAEACSIPAAAGRLLVSRGIKDPEDADRFLKPRLSDLSDPFLLPHMEAGVERCMRAIHKGERIAVFGDYDVDGITSTVLMTSVLERLGARVSSFIPHRMEEGYGVSRAALERCLEDVQPSLIITVDCGTGSVEEVAIASKQGCDLIVTDHHLPQESVAPAVAVINPRLGDRPSDHVLAGVGVAFKFCHALVKRLRDEEYSAASGVDLREDLDLVALGTIADIVPLTHENRILVSHGLKRMNQRPRPGIAALRDVAGIRREISTYEVGFQLGPRINASGRLGDAMNGLRLLQALDMKDVMPLARELDGENRRRQDVEAALLATILEGVGDGMPDWCVVAEGRGWHPGVVGIVASRLAGKFYRPSVVIAVDDQGMGKGSCRGISGVPMTEALDRCADLLVSYGGHAMAAGLVIEESRVDAFRERFGSVVRDLLGGEEPIPVQRIDAWLGLHECDEDLLAAMDHLKPFGMEHPTPVWGIRGVRVAGEPRVVGEKHLKFDVITAVDRRSVIAFGMAGITLPQEPLDLACKVVPDTFRGGISLQLEAFRTAS